MATTLSSPETAQTIGRASSHGLDAHGLRNPGTVFWNLTPAELVEHAVRRGEGILVEG